MKRLNIFFFSIFTLFFASYLSGVTYAREHRLPEFATAKAPWLNIAPNSEQRQPVYIGSTPRELSLRLKPVDGGKMLLHNALKKYGEEQLDAIFEHLNLNKKVEKDTSVEIQGYPVRNDDGILTWAFYKWKKQNEQEWEWIDERDFDKSFFEKLSIKPILPKLLDPKNKNDYELIFNDMLDFDSLYDKPAFGECIWTQNDVRAQITSAWLSLEKREKFAKKIGALKNKLCRAFPQPARFNGNPVSFTFTVNSSSLLWPSNIQWKGELQIPIVDKITPSVTNWPLDFKAKYMEDLMVLDGEKEAIFPISNKQARFTLKNNAEPNNQLLDIVTYLEERYRVLKIKTSRQNFKWRGKEQANLIAVIKGTNSGRSNKPVVIADHYDTAFCQDIFDKDKKRVSTSGADDNMSATATLLRAAEILNDLKPTHDILLLHLTGEEYPADDLGARIFTAKMLKKKQDLSGIVLLDMIGWRQKDDKIFQVNAGDSENSLKIADMAIKTSDYITNFTPVLRTRFDKKSYLYNTDGLIFSDAGYPVILFNEHINAAENLERSGYHDTTDTSARIDFDYASDIAKVAIETASILAK